MTVSETGTGQGAVISPLLANIYLHYVFDLWAERWRRREATGDMIIVRYADDIVVGFEHEADARRFLGCDARAVGGVCAVAASGQDPPDRVRPLCGGQPRASAGLASRRPSISLASPSSADKSRTGNFLLKRKTRRDRMRAKLKEIKEELRRRMHQPIPEQGQWLGQVVQRLLRLPRRADQQRVRSARSATTSPTSGGARSGGAARRTARPGSG